MFLELIEIAARDSWDEQVFDKIFKGYARGVQQDLPADKLLGDMVIRVSQALIHPKI